jgi:hypothetical protein
MLIRRLRQEARPDRFAGLNPASVETRGLSLLWAPAAGYPDPVVVVGGVIGGTLDSGNYGVPSYARTLMGGAAVFDTKAARVWTGTGITWAMPVVGTIAVWCYTGVATSSLAQNYLFTAIGSPVYPGGPAFTLGWASGTLYAGWIDQGDDRVNTATVFAAGWHHVVCSWGADCRLWVDGALYATRGSAPDTDSTIGNANSELGLGVLRFNDPATDQTWGYTASTNAIADLRIWSLEYGDADVARLYQAPTRWELYAPPVRRLPFLGALTTLDTARPSADVSAGSWTPSTGTDLFAMVNDAGDSTYIRSSSGAGSDTCELDFPSMGTPGTGTVTFHIRHRATP